MSTVELTAQTLDDTLDGTGITLIDWWAEWCGPCKQFAPVYEEASERYDDITFAKIDTEAEQQLSAAVGISSIPTLMAFRDGVMVFQQAGALPGKALDELITAVRDLDMDEVHAKVAAQQAAEADTSAPE
ncbi:thioredoxin [Aeromicrobium sp. CF3.5]|uniref:thioredoxin n=1 Tax=Aeromicrobium sp. CF3.5 TaxID=3373078 RepID=UPI003EE70B75